MAITLRLASCNTTALQRGRHSLHPNAQRESMSKASQHAANLFVLLLLYFKKVGSLPVSDLFTTGISQQCVFTIIILSILPQRTDMLLFRKCPCSKQIRPIVTATTHPAFRSKNINRERRLRHDHMRAQDHSPFTSSASTCPIILINNMADHSVPSGIGATVSNLRGEAG